MRSAYTVLCLLPVLILAVLVSAPTANAQGGCYSTASPELSKLFNDASKLIAKRDDGSNDFDELVLYALTQSRIINNTKRDLTINKQETARTDKQVSASAGSNAITTLASKPNFPLLLGLAIEHGGVQQDVKDSVLTLSTSPYAFIAAISGDTAQTYQNNDFFRRIGASAQFNIANKDDVLASARRQQLQNWSLRFRLSDDRSTRSSAFEAFWKDTIALKSMAVNLVDTQALSKLWHNKELVKWWDEQRTQFKTAVVKAKETAASGAIAQAIENEMRCFIEENVLIPAQKDEIPLTAENKALLSSTLPINLTVAELDVRNGKADLEKKVRELDEAAQVTLAYDNTRVANGGDYSTGKFLYERKSFSPMKLVINAGVSIYHHPDSSKNQQTLRDVLAVISFEGKVGRSPFLANTDDASLVTYSFSGSYKRLMENRHIKDLKADIAAAQFKLSIPIPSGMEFPIAFTYANATEDVHKKEARAEFGMTLNLDKLRSLALAAAAKTK
jgi:hypothetical protein